MLSFLKAAVKASVGILLKIFVKEIAKATAFSENLTVKAVAAITVLRGLKMEEEIMYLRLLVIAECGRMGAAVPTAITQLYSSQSQPATPTLVATAAPTVHPAPNPTPMLATKLVERVAPPRELKEEPKPFNPQNGYKTWVGFLNGVVRGSNVPWATLQGLTAKLVVAKTQFTEDDFVALFSAMKVANEKGQHIVSNKANPAKLFAMAPVVALDDLLFGQDGLLPAVTIEIANQSGDLPNWLCAKCSILLDAIEVADTDNHLGQQEAGMVEKFLDAVEERNPPNWLLEKGSAIWGGGSSNSPTSLVPNNTMAEKMQAALAS